MAARKGIKDEFAQFMRLNVIQIAANTLTFSQVALGLAGFQYMGILIHRIEYFVSHSMLALMTADLDYIQMAITGDGSMTSFATTDPAVYDYEILVREDLAAAANNNAPVIFHFPIVKDLSTLPGGGLLVPARNIFIGLQSSGLANPGQLTARLWYTVKELKAEDYIELAQSLQVLTSS